MYELNFLNTENELNKILKSQRKTKQDIGVLFISLWDPHSTKLVKRLKKRPVKLTRKSKPLYIIESFTMPHAFVIFKTTKVPHLVQFKKGVVESEDYLSKIYDALGV